jgi:hypothetical protein
LPCHKQKQRLPTIATGRFSNRPKNQKKDVVEKRRLRVAPSAANASKKEAQRGQRRSRGRLLAQDIADLNS